MLALKSFRDARPGLPDLLNWGFLVADGVVLCKDGSLLAGWLYEGPDLDASPDSQLNWVSEQMNAALARLSGGWCAPQCGCDLTASSSARFVAARGWTC